MRKLYPFILAAALFAPSVSEAAVLNAVSGSISYQGRLEKDSAPVSGKVLMYFRVYGTSTSGETICLWGPTTNNVCSCQSCANNVEQQVSVVQGLFGVNLTPPPAIFYNPNDKTLEVQVGETVLSPREPLQAVPYAFLSKRLEDNTDIAANTLSAAYDVAISTVSGSLTTLGSASYITTDLQKNKLNVYGVTRLHGDLYVNDVLFTRGDTSSVGTIAAQQQATIKSNAATTPLGGDIVFYNRDSERMRIVNDTGNVGVGSSSPLEVLEVNGNITNTTGNFGLFPQDALVIRPKGSELKGVLRLMPKNASQQSSTVELYSKVDSTAGVSDPSVYTRGSVGMLTTDLLLSADMAGVSGSPAISFKVSGTEKMRIPETGEIVAYTGVHAGNVNIAGSIVSAHDDGTLILQSGTSEPYPRAVVVGSSDSNLAVDKVKIYGNASVGQKLTAASAAIGITSDHGGLSVTEDTSKMTTHIVAGNNTDVSLSSTTIWGDSVVHGALDVKGVFSIMGDAVASQVGVNVFQATNTFINSVYFSSNTARVFGYNSVPSGFSPLYLYNIGGSADTDSRLYLMAGSGDLHVGTADSALYFRRGPHESAVMKTNQGNNLLLTVNTLPKVYFNSAGGIQYFLNGYSPATFDDTSSDLLVSTAANTTSLYINSVNGRIGMGTQDVGGTVGNPSPILTVNGDLRVTNGAIVFPDGTSMATSSMGSVGNISTFGNANVMCYTAVGATDCSVVLQANGSPNLVLKSRPAGGAYVGVGTTNPQQQLHVLSGNIMVGNLNASMDQLNNIAVAGSAYLAIDTTRTTRVGIGLSGPAEKLDVGGNIQMTKNSARLIFNGTGPHSIYMPDAADLVIATTTAKVGIGLLAPAQKLDVAGNIQLTAATPSLIFSGTGPHQITTSAGDLALMPAGNFGVGTTIPGYKLSVYDTSAGVGIAALTQVMGGLSATSTGTLTLVGGLPSSASNGGSIALGGSGRTDAMKSSIQFSVNGTEYMRVDGNYTGHTAGAVGIGTTNPLKTLHLAAANPGAELIMENTGGLADWRKWDVSLTGGSGAKQNMLIRVLNDAGTTSSQDMVTLYSTGSVAVAGAFSATGAMSAASVSATGALSGASVSATGNVSGAALVAGGTTGYPIPVGTIILYVAATCPAGFLALDGSTITAAAYPALAAVMGYSFSNGSQYALPNMQDNYPRGYGGAHTGTGMFGKYQEDTFQGHYHTYPSGATGFVTNVTSGGDGAIPAGSTQKLATNTGNPIADGSFHGTPRTADETRPKSVVLLYCIKY